MAMGREAAEVAPGESGARPRSYDSELRRRRAAHTRAQVLDAAHRLFVERGWAGTGVRDIARAAGVSVKTVYDGFGSKADLFRTVLDVAVVGDDEPVAMMDREQFALLAGGDLPERAAAGARLAAEVNRRTVDLKRVWRVAADTDPALAERFEEDIARQRLTARAAVQLMAGGDLDPDEADGMWALSSDEVYALLVQHAGWTHEKYEHWLTGVVARLLAIERPRTGEMGRRERG